MSLKYAILGFLDLSPFSGYDLMHFFKDSVNFYWSATHTQIYRTLKTMHSEELVERETIPQTDAPNKKVYHITDKGRTTLNNWLRTSQELPQIKHKFLLQLSFAENLSNDEILTILNSYKDKLEKRLSIYDDIEKNQIGKRAKNRRQNFLWHAILDNGIYYYQAEYKWINEVMENLKDLPDITS